MKITDLMRKLIPLVVLVGGIAIAAVLIATPPRPELVERKDNASLVETIPASFSQQQFTIPALGVVQPAQDVMIQPQVGGIVVAVSERLVPGGHLAKGDVLFEIEPTDYQIAVDTRRTQLAEAEANLALENGRQEVARREWALFADDSGMTEDPGLALREPQLKAAEAVVASARAQLRQAQVNLERTTVRAPFNAVVRSESVELGQTLSPQSQAARLAGTDVFRIQASVPVKLLSYIDVSDKESTAAEVFYDAGRGVISRDGQVVRVLSDLDPQGQMARVHIEVTDPLGLAADTTTAPLWLDSYVNVNIKTHHGASVMELRRGQLRDGDRIWIDNDGVLEIRPVDVVWRLEHTVLIGGGLEPGERIVTSSLNAPVAGMRLREAKRPGVAVVSEGTHQ